MGLWNGQTYDYITTMYVHLRPRAYKQKNFINEQKFDHKNH